MARIGPSFKTAAASTIAAIAALLAVVAPAEKAVAAPVCAEVKIEIQQQVSMERQAFNATLRINNGLDGIEVKNINVSIRFEDEFGMPVPASSDPNTPNAKFFIREDGTDGIAGNINAGASVPGGSVGEARWLIVPTADSGGVLPSGKIYRVGATVSYELGDDSTPREVQVAAETITVKPQPKLALDYFLPTNVFSNDPFTDEIEPPEPFTLGLRMRNVGYGPGRKIQIDSGQPTIVENELGLLVDFEIIGSSVGNEPGLPSLMVNLGDLDSQDTKVARWTMITSLNGRFLEFNASYSHAPELGGSLTSLLESITTYDLVHEVLVDLPGRDSIVDFLAYQRPGDVLRVYESQGVDTNVDDVSVAASVTAIGEGQFQFQVPTTSIFAFASVPIAASSTQMQVSALRSDGSPVPAQNVWVSKVQSLDDQSYTYYLNLFDTKFDGDYTVAMSGAALPGSLEGAVYFDADGNGIRGPGEPGMAGVVIELLTNGADGMPGAQQQVTTDAGGDFRFANLTPGVYTLVLGAAPGLESGLHLAGSAGGTVGSDGIGEITIESGANATDYLFSKREQGPDDAADIAVEFQLGTTPQKLSDPLEMSLVLRNLGPRDARAIQVDLTIPEFAEFETIPVSAGAFDRSLMRWTLESLAAGESVTATLEGRITQVGTHRFSALALEESGIGFDPDESNNTATKDVVIDPWGLSAELVAWARVLVLDLCAVEPSAANQCVDEELVGHANALTSFVEELGPADILVASNGDEMAEALMDGDWTVVWIRARGDELTGPMVNDLRMTLARGARLLVSASLVDAPSELASLLGISIPETVEEGAFAIVVTPDSPLAAGEHQGWGRYSPLQVEDGAVLAEFQGGGAAVVQRLFGYGEIWTFGFEPASGASESLSATLLSSLVDFSAPRQSDRIDTDGILAVTAELSAGVSGEEAEVATEWLESTTVLATEPSQGAVEGGRVSWKSTPEPDSTSTYSAEFIAPPLPGESAIEVAATRGTTGVESEIDQISIDVSVLDFAGFVSAAADRIESFNEVDEPSDDLKQEALAQVAAALAEYGAGRLTSAREALAAASTAVISHPQGGESPLLALEAIGYAHRIVRRVDRVNAPQCPVDGATPGLLDPDFFAERRPRLGFELEGPMTGRAPWLMKLGTIETPESETTTEGLTSGTITPVDSEELRFIYERLADGRMQLVLFRGNRLVARLVEAIGEEFDAIRISASLENVVGQPLINPALRVEIDRVDGVAVTSSLLVEAVTSRSGELHFQVPNGMGAAKARVQGRITPIFDKPVMVLPTESITELKSPAVRFRISHGRVDCEATP